MTVLDRWAAEATWLLRQASNLDQGLLVARLLSDHRFRAEMRFCNTAGVPHSVFLGWEGTDRDKALAYQAFAGQICSGCGLHPSEWETEDLVPFEAYSERCFGCQALARHGEHLTAVEESGVHVDRSGARIGLRFAGMANGA